MFRRRLKALRLSKPSRLKTAERVRFSGLEFLARCFEHLAILSILWIISACWSVHLTRWRRLANGLPMRFANEAEAITYIFRSLRRLRGVDRGPDELSRNTTPTIQLLHATGLLASRVSGEGS